MRRLLVLLALVALISLACGTAKINLHTIVRSSGDTTQEVSIEATGMLASSMKESADPEKAKADGWTVTYEEKEDSFTTKMSRDFKREEMLRTPFGETKEEGAPTLAQPQASFKINDSLIAREYEFRVKLAGSQAAPSAESSAEADQAAQELMKSLTGDIFKVSWSITLPGEIVETNADSKTATTATWNFGFDTLAKEREMVVKSRETNWVTIGGAAAVAAVIVVVVVILLLRRRAPSAPPAPAAPSAPISSA